MLTKWSLQGFKAFRERADLDIAPLTILAGANSSGKSTILQSILLLKQTVQYGAPTRPLSLNGPLIRLGTFDDIIPGVDEDAELRLSFTLSIDDSRGFSDRPPWSTGIYRTYAHASNKMEEISGAFIWSPQAKYNSSSVEQDRLKSFLKYGEINLSMTSQQDQLRADRLATYGTDKDSTQFFGPEENSGRWVPVTFDPLTEAELTEDKPDAVVGQMALSYFLPWYVSINYDAALKEAQDISEGLFGGSILTRSKLEGKLVSHNTLSVINDWLVENHRAPINDPGDNVKASYVAEVLSSQSIFYRNQTVVARNAELAALQSKVQSVLVSEIEPRRENDVEQPRVFSSAAEYIRTYLKSGIRYLGPLRDEPKPVYPLEALENPTDVGYRGEHTAAVLYLNGSTGITYTPPPQEKSGDSPPRRYGSLSVAVKDWLEYLGVATDIFASDAGVFGNQLEVTTKGSDKRHHLTNVGVGVSQVLPIVVSALLAPRASLLIFEQPELHLHPRVQARLADFFVALMMDGKQCLIETHSEYLIDRLRRRVAEQETDAENIRHKVSIYFTEKSGDNTTCTPIKLNKFGSVENWPKDFFDQSQFEVRRILEAAASKRIKERSNK